MTPMRAPERAYPGPQGVCSAFIGDSDDEWLSSDHSESDSEWEDAAPPPLVPGMEEGPTQPTYMGWTLSEWTIFFDSFSLSSWAVWSAHRGRSRWNTQQWLEYSESKWGLLNPITFPRWACGLD